MLSVANNSLAYLRAMSSGLMSPDCNKRTMNAEVPAKGAMPLGQLADYMVGLHNRGLAGQKVGREVSRGSVELRRRNMPNLQSQWSELRGSTPFSHPSCGTADR